MLPMAWCWVMMLEVGGLGHPCSFSADVYLYENKAKKNLTLSAVAWLKINLDLSIALKIQIL